MISLNSRYIIAIFHNTVRRYFLGKYGFEELNIDFLEQMIDFYFMIHYVMYRYYRRHNEDSLTSMITACCLQAIFSEALMILGEWLLSRLLGYQSIINKAFYFVLFKYFCYYLNFLYSFGKIDTLKFFGEYAKQIGTPAMKRKMKNAKIFNYSIFIVDIILLFIVDYLNHHGG